MSIEIVIIDDRFPLKYILQTTLTKTKLKQTEKSEQINP